MATEPLLETMRALRDPEQGCPWDRQQTYHTIVPYTIEEAYEVADAIERNDFDDLKNELGDLLFQVVFYCQLAQEDSHFKFSDVVNAVNQKLISRHPHVFENETYQTEDELNQAWEEKKHQERGAKSGSKSGSFLDDIPLSLPALKRAQKMQKRAARQGFDWPDIQGVWSKINEEVAEVKAEEASLIILKARQKEDNEEADAIDKDEEARRQERLEEEVGDLLFSVVNLSRFHDIDAEVALRKASTKFERRFRHMEQELQVKQQDMKLQSLEQLEALWQNAKDSI